MNFFTYSGRLSVSALSILVTDCVTSEQVSNQTTLYSVDAVYNTNSVVFSDLNVVESDQGRLLEGKIRRRSANKSEPSGHVDVLVSTATGDILLDTAVHYSPSILMRYMHSVGQRGSKFSVYLPDSLPKDADIRVTYHRNSFQKSASSPSAHHYKNSLL